MPIQQPSNQIKFTNVSIVRLKKGKKRFELACYKNKLLEYRSGAEKDLDNVLQVPTIFLSVSKAQTAPSAELAKSFGRDVSSDEIRQEILRKGEVQVGERERKEIIERVEREMLDIVSGRLVDPNTKRVYTSGMIAKALDQLSSASGQLQTQGQDGDGEAEEARPKKPLWTGVVEKKSAKIQALEAMKALIAWQPIPVMRARMRLRVSCPVALLKQSVKAGPAEGAPKAKEGGGQKSNPKTGKKNAKGSKKSGKHQESDEGSDAELPVPAAKAPGTVKDKVLSYIESVETQEVMGDEWEVVGFADPGAFKGLNEFVGNETRGRGRVEVLDMTVTQDE
ncbi:Shwachman-Bodian-diamond syndrome protein [Aspergillus campestris IBT 28561]|uniref:Shwachman-Bodian-diamond syndrome protein n=2 Tax=Aspergillus subgen. Circumdati TaxID=2720871 RepID=A0A2I2F998_ASPCN|nr:Shwachman-Bodian-diamond syndrome protein [Aspergillus candidus]XP_024694401.1 Shwachman-Bodian-diamond syndrome protein [Aspergillus campestris IBT 28561]PKY05807.1 Shwachman-Bodian-diamond syndrome protein [Aspergillus campestris IBT 28561]PLB37216.1 Shwachman-Bodian-diamond syndrome protein [Aspergillus candidus]